MTADRTQSPIDTSRVPTSTRRAVLWIGISSAAVLCTVLIAAVVRSYRTPPPVGVRVLVVLPMDNETGDPGLDYVTSGIVEGITRRLERTGGLQLRTGARSEWPASSRHDSAPFAGEFGSRILLRTVLARVGDSLEVRASVLDADTKREKTLAARRFAISQLREVESGLAAHVFGAVFRVAQPSEPRPPDHPIDAESYRLTLEGWHQLMALRNPEHAKDLFIRATEKDRTNARAFAGLSAAWGRQTITHQVPFDVGYDRMSAAAASALALDSLQGSALANLAFVGAWKFRSLAVGEDLFRRAKAAEPSNAEIYQLESALYRHAWQWDKAEFAIRIAQQLDPLRSSLVGLEAGLLVCQNRVAEAERLLRQEIAVNPTGSARTRFPAVLARLGRYDEAIDAMREDALQAGQDSVAVLLAGARGQSGYWSSVQRSGRARLAQLQKQAKRTWASPYVIMLAQFEAGDTARAYGSLAKLERERDLNLVMLRCAPEIDAERGNPRLDSALKRIPAFPLR